MTAHTGRKSGLILITLRSFNDIPEHKNTTRKLNSTNKFTVASIIP